MKVIVIFFFFKAMRKGLLDVIPKNALEDLTAEDFRLLVNGCGEVNVQMLISFTSFNDESGMLYCLKLCILTCSRLIFVSPSRSILCSFCQYRKTKKCV